MLGEQNDTAAARDIVADSRIEDKATTPPPARDADPSSADAQIESASQIDTASAQPPIVSAPESDLRENPIPVKQGEAATLQEEKRELDALNDSDLARTTQDTEASQPDSIQQPISPATTTDEVDQVKPPQEPESKDEDFAIRPATMSQLDINAQSPMAQSPMAESPNAAPSREVPPSAMDASPKSPRDTGKSDTEMADAPPVSSIKHERDEDPAEESAAKRPKTESPSQNGLFQANQVEDENPEDKLPITQYQIKEIRKSLRATKSTIEGRNFKAPVVDLWPAIKDLYLEKVANPIDLSIIERKLTDEYTTIAEYKADLELLYQNCVAFNGPDHDVSKSGRKVRDQLLSKMPPREQPKPAPRKKGQAVRKEAPVHERRTPYQGTGHGQSPHPPATQTFALDPSGTPVIRRDSTKTDGGRPKRDIHPPKPRDIAYNARPKKKKYAAELRFCETVIDELKRPKYLGIAAPFLIPVDPVALGIPDYFKFIKNPMDLGTVSDNLHNGHYETAKHFEQDIRLIFKNCYKFNPEGTPVNIMGHDLEAVFDELWAQKNTWVEKHMPSAPASPDSSAESAAEESEEEEEAEDPETAKTTALMQARLVDEQQKLIDIMTSGGDQALIRMQSEMVEIVKKQLQDFIAKNSASKKKKKKTKAPTKKAQPQKKGSKLQTNKPYKVKSIGQTEKEQISAGITQLEGNAMDQAIAYLKKDYPELDLETDPELDIDQFSNETLSRLHDLIQRHCPQVIPPPEPRAPRPQKPVKPKKNKPMSKHEQEKKIQHLRNLQQQFRQGSASDDARLMPCKYTLDAITLHKPLNVIQWSESVHWLTTLKQLSMIR